MKTKIVTLYVFLLTCLVSSAQTPVSDALVHEIITECVSKTGGFIIKEETKLIEYIRRYVNERTY